MQRYPILKMAAKGSENREKRKINIPSTRKYSKYDQKIKIAEQIKKIEISVNATGIAYEYALVFETRCPISNFIEKAKKNTELEFLCEQEVDFEEEDESYSGRLYAYMPNDSSLQKLLRIWKIWERTGEGQELNAFKREVGKGYSPWIDLFYYLKKIRLWGPEDRILSEDIKYWKNDLKNSTNKIINIEVEFWFLSKKEKRNKIYNSFVSLAKEINANILDHVIIEQIRYHACLISLPASKIKEITERNEIQLINHDSVMYIRHQSVASVSQNIELQDGSPLQKEDPKFLRKPFAALLDGVPVQAHKLLENFIHFHDPDDYNSNTLVKDRLHGTQMASIIIHGDKNKNNEIPLSSPLYVRPIMRSHSNKFPQEVFPQNRLLIDVIHKAVLDIKDKKLGGGTVSPDVFIVNLSLGDSVRPFSGLVSPWARLLDFLSWEYNILFIVSAGNIPKESLSLKDYNNFDEIKKADDNTNAISIGRALLNDSYKRTILSPAESINSLTIGACHEDYVEDRSPPADSIDPINANDFFPNTFSALGLGYHKSVKPEIFFPAGREHLRFKTYDDNGVSVIPDNTGCGIRCASTTLSELDKGILCCGTSAATALATRAACQIFYSIMDNENGAQLTDLEPRFYPIVVKSLITHTARWGRFGKVLYENFPPPDNAKHVQRKNNVTKLLGYGKPEITEAMECSKNRVTLVGWGEAEKDCDNIYRIPLPTSLIGERIRRSITITLAWFSPIEPSFNDYRLFKLFLAPKPDSSSEKWKQKIGVERSQHQPNNHAVVNGTIMHSHFEGEKSTVFDEVDHLNIRVSCSVAGDRDRKEKIPYALAVTIKAFGEIDIYEEIKQKLQTTERTQTRIR